MFSFINSLNYYSFSALCLILVLASIVYLVIRRKKLSIAAKIIFISAVIILTLIFVYITIIKFSSNPSVIKIANNLNEVSISLCLMFAFPISFFIASRDKNTPVESREPLLRIAVFTALFGLGFFALVIGKLINQI